MSHNWIFVVSENLPYAKSPFITVLDTLSDTSHSKPLVSSGNPPTIQDHLQNDTHPR